MSVRIELADGGVAPSAIYPWSVSGTVNVGDVVALDASAAKTVLRADADNASARPPIGVCIARSGSLAQVALNGEIASGLSGLTRGTAYWLSTSAGQLVSTKPGSNAYAVGVAVSATELLVDGCLAVLDGSGGGGVNSVGVTSSDSSLTVSNSPITGSGSVGLALNTVGVAKGGTGLTSASEQGAMPYASSTSAYVMQSVSPTFKNRIINGGMTIAQRGTAAVSADGGLPLDRWRFFNNTGATASGQQSADAATGFSFSYIYSVTTGVTATTAAYAQIHQVIEGNNVSDLAWGTAGAKTITLSFWVKSSVAGTYGIGFHNALGNRSYVATYNVTAGSWQRKSITVSGDQSGTWYKDSNAGIRIVWDLGSGSNYNTTNPNTWESANASGVSGKANLIGTTGATFYLTGVQLEVGSVATAFELRPEQIDLALCQRYFQRMPGYVSSTYVGLAAGVVVSTASALMHTAYVVPMRAQPTMTLNLPLVVNDAGSYDVTSLSTVYYGDKSLAATYLASLPLAGRACILYQKGSATAGINLSAEL